MYHREEQTAGKKAHETIDTKKYSTKKSTITGLPVYSEKYNLSGSIDIYDGLIWGPLKKRIL